MLHVAAGGMVVNYLPAVGAGWFNFSSFCSLSFILQPALRRIIKKQPGLLSHSMEGDVLEKMNFFVGEMGLEVNQVARVFCSFPQASLE